MTSATLDMQAAEEACRQHYHAVYRYVAFRVACTEDAEDLTSEVFLRLLHHDKRPIRSVIGYCYRIAENLIIDYYRKRAFRRRMFRAESDSLSDDEAVAITPAYAGRLDLIQGLRRLKGNQYTVIVMRFIEGYSIREIASHLGKSEGAVKACQFRALQSLRAYLAPFGNHDYAEPQRAEPTH